MRKGFAEILIVFILCIVGMLVVTAWQTRLFSSIHRMGALTDILKATYGSESSINDAIARFVGGYPSSSDETKTLADGTKITTKFSNSGDTDTFNVFAQRQYASTNIVLTKVTSTDMGAGFKSLETILVTDCTTSMSDPASSSCESSCGNFDTGDNKTTYFNCLTAHSCTTRMHELKKAALAFVDNLIEFQTNNASKTIKLGWTVFRQNAATVNDPTIDLVSIKNQINSGLSDLQQDSSVCTKVFSNTSIGSGLDLANKYFSMEASNPQNKRFEVMISDGEPNSRYSSYTGVCGTKICTSCNTDANAFMQCALKTIDQSGSRPNDVDAYTVTVLDTIASSVSTILNDYSTKYFNQGDATKLTEILANIFNDIIKSSTSITIQRVIPTPEP